MLYKTLFIDLDDTLYPHTSGLWEAIRLRMDQYMHERLGLPLLEIARLRKQYFETYGTTLRGLQNHLHVDAQDFLAYVHDLPLDQYLKPNPVLRQVLQSLPQKKFIFTNADRAHAQRVLKTLMLEGCFEEIIDVNALQFIPKPDMAAYRRALELAKAQPATSILFDDAVRNLLPAHQLGFLTVLVGAEIELASNGFDLHLNLLEDLPARLPELWSFSIMPKEEEK